MVATKRSSNALLCFILAFLMLGSAAAILSTPTEGDRGDTIIFGHVTEKGSNDSIENVKITISADYQNESYMVYTNSEGYYEQAVDGNGNYSVTAKKNGYESETTSIYVREGDEKRVDFELEKEGSGDDTIIRGHTKEKTNGTYIPQVFIRITKGEFKKTGSSDDNGYYEFELPGEGTYHIHAEKSGYKDYDVNVTVEGGKTTTHHILMEKEQSEDKTTIHGYTVDKDNETHIAHVYVKISGDRFQADEYSDENGYYDFELPEGGNYTIEAEKSGYEDYERGVYAEHEKNTTHHIFMEKENSGDKTILKGYTVEEDRGEHIPYVDIRIMKGNYSKTTESNGDGYYEVELPEGGRYEIRAEKDGYKDYDAEVTVNEGKENTHHIYMEKEQSGEKTTIHGYTIDKDNETHIPHVYVVIYRGDFEADEYSDDHGYYDFELPEGGNYTIEAKKDGYKDYEEHVYAAHEKNTTHHIQMEKESSGDKTILKGYTLEDDRGEHIPYVDIRISRGNYSKTTESDRDGYYEVELPEGGEYDIRAEKEGYKDYEEQVYVHEGKENTHHIYMEKEQSGNETTIHGYTIDKDNETHLSYVYVVIRGEHFEAEEYSDDEGYYDFELPEGGDYIIEAQKNGYEDYEDVVYAEHGKNTTHHILMEKSGSGDKTILKGYTAEDDRGEHIPYVDIQILKGEYNQTTRSNGDGYYEVELPEGGRYEVLAEKEGYEDYDEAVTVQEGKENTHHIYMEKEQSGEKTTIHGYTIDKDNETHIPHVYVVIYAGDFEKSEYSNEEGYYDFELPEGGNYTIEAQKDGYKDYEEMVHAAHEKNTTHHIQMESDGSGEKTILKGYTAEDDRGEHIPYVDIRITRGNYSKTTESNGDGYYEVELPEGGEYDIRAEKEGYKDYEGQVHVTEGKENTHHIYMEKEDDNRTILEGFVRDHDTHDLLKHVDIIVYTKGHDDGSSTKTNENGYYYIEREHYLGNLTLVGEKEGYERYETILYLDEGERNTYNFSLEREGDVTILRGVVYNSETYDGIPGASVTITGQECNCSYTLTTNTHGVYEQEIDYIGNYAVQAKKSGYEPSHATVYTPEGETTTLNLTLSRVQEEEKPDLEVKSIVVKPGHPNEGDLVNITAIIRNRGDADAHNVTVVFYDNADGMLQVTLQIAEFNIPEIKAGGEYIATAIWDTSGQSGENIIWVVVDPFNSIEEKKEDNNEVFYEIQVRNSQDEYGVSVTTASYSLEFDDQRYKVVTVSVENTGTVEDTYQITITGTHGGWKVTIDTPDTITLEAGEIRTLSVTIQEDVAEGGDNSENGDGENRTKIRDGDSVTVIVTATSTTYPGISDSATIDGIIKLSGDDAIPDLTTPLIAVSIGAGALVAFFRRRD